MTTQEWADRLRDKAHRDAIHAWIVAQLEQDSRRFVCCDFTLKQALLRDNGTLALTTKQDAERAMTSFLKRLDGAVYKNAASRHDLRLSRFGAVEGSRKACKRLHIHVVIEHPDFLDFDAFKAIILHTWRKCPLSMTQSEVQQVADGTVGTVFRYLTKTGTDAICVGNMELARRAR
jgi:hypothetical protein